MEQVIYNPGNKIEGKISWRSPSNIAIVKYWGKGDYQTPMNPSISMSLSGAYTQTEIEWKRKADRKDFSFKFSLDGQSKPDFENKITSYFERIYTDFPFLKEFHINIESSNTFPHSSGIASSASSMSALALCLLSLSEILYGKEHEFYSKASYFARIGSGSASRSVFPGWSLWGKTAALEGSSDLFAVDINNKVHPVFHQMRNSILIVSTGRKPISSSQGHKLMETHPFRKQRIKQANDNCVKLLSALKEGDIDTFINITETEAITLHVLMKSSVPGYILTHPNSLTIMEEVYNFRETTGARVCFSLDAGPNIHLLYPENEKDKIQPWIKETLLKYCEDNKWIDDKIGNGPQLVEKQDWL